MNFQIFSRSDAKRFSYSVKEPCIIISITDPDKLLNNFAATAKIIDVCRLQFDDVDRETKRGAETLMSFDDAMKIKRFVERYKNRVNTIVVHCEAGISRSAAVAAAIGKYLNGDDSFVFDNPKYYPNMHCYSTTLKALMLDDAE